MRFPVRLRPLAALSAVAVSMLVLSACSAQGEPDATPTSSACLVAASAGADSDAVKVDANTDDLSVTVPEGLSFAETQRTVTTEGDGAVVGTGSAVTGSYKVLNGATGEVMLDSAATSATGDGLVPILVDGTQLSLAGAAVDCVPLGSTVVLTVPGSAMGDAENNYVIVARSAAELPTTATGAPQPPVDGMPEVALADDGAPSITIPSGDAPTEVQIAELKKGDGPVVESGDNVTVQYLGVKWSDGTEFDSSWTRGAPAQFPTTGVVEGFQQALEGQQVGSQVLVVIPPAFGYAADPSSELKDETLVFVIDILGTQHTPAQ